MYNTTILIGMGANLHTSVGSPARTLAAALGLLAVEGLGLRAVSRFYRSPAFPAGSGPDYVNACAMLTGPNDPEAILAVLHRIEAGLGRQRSARWAARGIDLDLLAMGEVVSPDAATQAQWRHLPLAAQMKETPDRLILPHPRIADRAFVLIPLAEIAPAWRHPATGETVAEMANRLDAGQKAGLEPLITPFGGV